MKNIVPKGYLEITQVFNRLGRIHYGQSWTGQELTAQHLPSPDEISAERQKAAKDYEELNEHLGVEASMVQESGKPPGHLVEKNPYLDDSLPNPKDQKYLAEREARQRRDDIEGQLIDHLYNGDIPSFLKDQHGEINKLPSRLWQSTEFTFSVISNTAQWQINKQTNLKGAVLLKTDDAKEFPRATKAGAQAQKTEKGVPLRGRGRPSVMPKILEEMRHRKRSGELKSSMYAEASGLAEWAKTHHPKEAPRAHTIENNDRAKSLHKILTGKNPPEK